MSDPADDRRLRAHVELTRRLVGRARREGNEALARELERQADALEQTLSAAA